MAAALYNGSRFMRKIRDAEDSGEPFVWENSKRAMTERTPMAHTRKIVRYTARRSKRSRRKTTRKNRNYSRS